MTLAIERYADTAHAALSLAQAVSTELKAALACKPRGLLLLSGGSSPLAFFDALRGQPIAWERIDISLVDERSVSADDEAANTRLVRTHLLCGAAAAAHWIGLLPEDEDEVPGSTPWKRAQGAALQANRTPALAVADVIVLGVGSDGHTASLFVDAPQWPLAQVTHKRYLALQPGSAPYARISLSLDALRQHGRCHIWAIGAEKYAVLTNLQKLVAQTGSLAVQSSPPPHWLADAGPIACLIADPAVRLTAYCTAEAGF